MNIKELERREYNKNIESLYGFITNCSDWKEKNFSMDIDFIHIRVKCRLHTDHPQSNNSVSNCSRFTHDVMAKMLARSDISHSRILGQIYYLNMIYSILHRATNVDMVYLQGGVLTFVDVSSEMLVEISIRKR